MSYCVLLCVVVSCMCWPRVHLSRMCWSAKMDWCTLPHTGCPRILCSWSFSSAEKVLILFNKAAPAQNWQYFAQLCPEMQTFLFLYIFLKTKMTDYPKFLVLFLCSHSTTHWLWRKVHHIFVLWKSSRPLKNPWGVIKTWSWEKSSLAFCPSVLFAHKINNMIVWGEFLRPGYFLSPWCLCLYSVKPKNHI